MTTLFGSNYLLSDPVSPALRYISVSLQYSVPPYSPHVLSPWNFDSQICISQLSSLLFSLLNTPWNSIHCIWVGCLTASTHDPASYFLLQFLCLSIGTNPGWFAECLFEVDCIYSFFDISKWIRCGTCIPILYTLKDKLCAKLFATRNFFLFLLSGLNIHYSIIFA